MKKFGNWDVKDEGILWTTEPFEYFISRIEIHSHGSGERTNVYDWLIHTAEKTWVSRKDMADLNNAFLYAFEYYGIGEAENLSWKETMELQEIILSMKD